MSRKSNTEERRHQITTAFLKVLAEAGYERATVIAVAKEAALTPGLIHYHFKSKREILLNLVESLVFVSSQRYQQLSQGVKSPHDALFAYIDARLAKGDDAQPEAVAAWVMIGAEAVRDSEVRTIFQAAIRSELDLASSLIKECLKAENKRTKQAATLAAGFVAFMEGSFQLASAAQEVMPQGYAARTAKQMMMAAILSEESRN